MSANNEPSDPKPAVNLTPPTSQGVGGTPPTKSNGPVGLSDDLLARAAAIFGPVEIIRLEDDTRPLGTFLDAVRRALKGPYANSVIAVPCGGQSALCAIVANMADVESLAALLKENTCLNDTVWTRWNNFVLIWLRLEGWHAGTTTLPGISWIGSECLLPVVDVPDAGQCSGDFPVSSKGAAIMTVNFKQLVWPADVHEIFAVQRLESQYGRLLEIDPLGRVIIGDLTAAHFFAERLKLSYTRTSDAYTMIADGETTLLPKAQLTKIIGDWLRQQAAAVGITYSTDAPVKMVIEKLRHVCAVAQFDAGEGLQLFLVERLERKDGASVTAEELYQKYQIFAQARGAACYSRQIFCQRIAVALREQFGICRSRSVRRPNPDNGGLAFRTGYRGLAIAGIVGTVGTLGTVGGLEPLPS